ncbi:MAG: FecR domain-containing protein [Thiobacillus sp.]
MKSFLRKKNARISILIILALVFGIGYLLTRQVAPRPSYNAEISLVNGRVEKSTDKNTWTALKSNESITQGSYIRTGTDSRTIITLDDGSAVRLSDDSQIKLSSLDPKNIQITNERGEVYTRVVKADRTFVVSVGSESYKSLGTAYKTINTDSEQGVYVYESQVKAEDADKTVPQGNKYFTKNKDKDLVNKLAKISKYEITKDTFVQWNKDIDSKNKEFKKYLGVLTDATDPTPTKPAEENNSSSTSNDGSIYLSGSKTDGGVLLRWSVANLDASNGFKLVKSTQAYPTYPGSSYLYISDANTRSYKWGITDGVTYHFRVCRYTGGGCDVYSNDITVQAPYTEPASAVVNSITLSDLGGGNIKWSVNGYSDKGFKVVWSDKELPVYPGPLYHYYSSPSQTTDKIGVSDVSGIKGYVVGVSRAYYVRVCEYLGGACGKYSNQISINL